MLPDNVLSTKNMPAKFMYPDGVNVTRLTEDYELGGIALQDPSKGLQYQPWFGYWEAATTKAVLIPTLVTTPVEIFTQPDVFEFGFTFDQNMRWVAGTLLTTGEFLLRWYDSAVGGYVITSYAGITGFKLTMDDKRQESILNDTSDVLFTYIRDNKLFVRTQRERFLIEHLLMSNLPSNLTITNFGMNEILRVQWRLRYRRLGELLPWLA